MTNVNLMRFPPYWYCSFMLGKVVDVLMTEECDSFSQPRYILRHTEFADLCILATFRHTV